MSEPGGSSPPPEPTPGRWEEIERVLDAALEVPPREWPDLLDRMCGEDPELRREVESLLRRHREIDGFLEGTAVEASSPPSAPREAPPAGSGRAGGAAGPDSSAAPSSDADASEGGRIGAYRVVRLIARGGMGEVYLAERADGHFEQRVALKLLPAGLDADGVDRRFRTERQILAGLEHPSVARLLDGGVTDAGRPYLVMEYVEGEPIDRHCDGRRLPVRKRLELFLQVTEAVEHAHRALVVHRDLKPSNILVTSDGRAKLLDFGIAKLLGERRGTAAPVTRTGRRWMTPQYAAPEQIESEPVTTATDVYQLGVLLYQLVSGRLPFAEVDGSLHRLERAILETAPEKPSTAATRRASAGETGAGPADPAGNARARSTRPGRLRGTLRGDLDAIVLKALRKEPSDRYPSVSAMAEDIDRHLRGRPVAARRGTAAYRSRKFLRRHRWGVAAAAAFLLLLAGYAATVTVQSERVREALGDARTEARKAEQVSEFLVGLFEASDPGEAPGDTITARELLERGVERAGELEGQPEVQATMLDEMGRVYQSLGRYDRAEPLLRRALALRRSLHGEDHLEVAKSLDNVATVLQKKGRYDEAEPLFRRALAVRRGLGDRAEANVDVGLNNLALLLHLRGKFDEAERLYRRSLATKRERFGDGSAEVATALHNLASLLRKAGDAESAEPLYRRALDVRRGELGADHPLVAQTVDHLGALLVGEGDHGAADSLLRDALEVRRRVLGEDHPDVTVSLHNLARLRREEGRYDEAEALAREVLARDRRQLGQRHPYVADGLIGLARVHLERGEAGEAEPLLRNALDIREEALPADHWEVAETEGLLGECLAALGRHADAEGLLRESHARLLSVFGAEDRRTRRASERLAAMRRASDRAVPAARGAPARDPE